MSPEELKKVEIRILDGNKREVAKKTKLDKAEFEFSEVRTGVYSMEIKGDEYCFKTTQMEIKISGEVANNELKEKFTKTGYSLRYESSHLIKNAILKQKGEKVQTITFESGKNTVCITKPGDYKIEMPRCY